MQMVRTIIQKLNGLGKLSKFCIRLGAGLMVCTYIVALAARISAPQVADYFGAMAIYRGCLEAAPAFLVVGICSALLGDLMLASSKGKGGDSSDSK